MPKALYEKRDRIAYVTFNRPEAKNAIDPEMQEELVAIWTDFRDSDDVDVAIVTGAGDAFRAGADLKTYIPPIIKGERPIRDIVDLGFGGFTRGLHKTTKPIVGAINGWALAGGLEQALACDIRIASDRAMFGSFEARRGYPHGDGLVGGPPGLPPRGRRDRAAGQRLRRRRCVAHAADGRAGRRAPGARVASRD